MYSTNFFSLGIKLIQQMCRKKEPINWGQLKEGWISEVRDVLIPKLLKDDRFERSSHLIGRFEHEVVIWLKTGAFRPIIEIGNELAAAECLLDNLGGSDKLIYEPPMAGTDKRIDFLRISVLGKYDWIEVKTVTPQWDDNDSAWQRFIKINNSSPGNTNFNVNKCLAGAAVSGQAIKARWSFVRRTAEVEAKAKFIPLNQAGNVWLLFCSNGSNWHIDELEDFSDYYHTNAHRADDWLQNEVDRYIFANGISFDRTLAGFYYLARRHEDKSASLFSMNFSGPSFGR